jgi:hypothetical protein
LDQKIKAQKRVQSKAQQAKAPRGSFEAEERGFEDQIWNVQIILAVGFCFNV